MPIWQTGGPSRSSESGPGKGRAVTVARQAIMNPPHHQQTNKLVWPNERADKVLFLLVPGDLDVGKNAKVLQENK